MRAKIFITGANGFLGSEVCAGFALQGFGVVAMVRSGANCERLRKVAPNALIVETDTDWQNLEALLAEHKPDIIVHTAAAMDGGDDIKSAQNLIETNILKPACLLAAAKASGVRGFITVGTAWQHYDDAAFNPVNLYAASKQGLDDILRYYAEAGMMAASLHMFDTYGPNDPRPKLVNLLFKLAQSGETLAMSPGEQEIDLIHTHDAARAFVMTVEQMLSGTHQGFVNYAVSGGNPMPLKQLAALAQEISGKKINIEWGGREYRPREVMKTWRTGKAVPGWQPQVSVRDGLTAIWQEN